MSQGQRDIARSNRLLGALGTASRRRIVPHLEPAKLKLGAIVCKAGGLLKHAYFPQGAVLSLLTVLGNGSAIETANIGREGTTRINLFRATCPCCRARGTAQAPADMPEGSPFGPGIQATIAYLHGCQMVSFKRLTELGDGLFDLTISQGAISNVLERMGRPFAAVAETDRRHRARQRGDRQR